MEVTWGDLTAAHSVLGKTVPNVPPGTRSHLRVWGRWYTAKPNAAAYTQLITPAQYGSSARCEIRAHQRPSGPAKVPPAGDGSVHRCVKLSDPPRQLCHSMEWKEEHFAIIDFLFIMAQPFQLYNYVLKDFITAGSKHCFLAMRWEWRESR